MIEEKELNEVKEEALEAEEEVSEPVEAEPNIEEEPALAPEEANIELEAIGDDEPTSKWFVPSFGLEVIGIIIILMFACLILIAAFGGFNA